MKDSGWVVLCDFDGTVATIDTAELVLDRFATDDWRKTQASFDRGEISLQQCLERQFSNVRGSREEMVAAVEDVARFRPGFEMFVEFCGDRGIHFVILSAGLDFVIERMLRKTSVFEGLALHIPRAEFTPAGVRFEYPRLVDPKARNFKEDEALGCQRSGKRVIFIGDGTPDFPAAESSDAVFSVQGSALSKMCERMGILHSDFVDFSEVEGRLDEILRQ